MEGLRGGRGPAPFTPGPPCSGFRTTEEPAGADGPPEAWVEFETPVAGGKGPNHLTRPAWGRTLLTTLYELKGHGGAEGHRPTHVGA